MQTITGKVQNVIYSNNSNAFVVFKADINNAQVSIKAYSNQVVKGANFTAKGHHIYDEKWGRQFVADTIEVSQARDLEGIINTLITIDGIGPVAAEKIALHFKDETLSILEQNPTSISKVKGLNQKQKDAVTSYFSDRSVNREAEKFLLSHGLTPNMSARIIRQFKENTINVITSNPYCLLEVDGIGFKTADAIAMGKFSIQSNDKNRVEACIVHVLATELDNAQCYALYNDLISKVKSLLRLESDDKIVLHSIMGLVSNSKIIVKEHKVFLPKSYNSNIEVAELLEYRADYDKHNHSKGLSNVSQADLIQAISNTEDKYGIQLSGEQHKAIMSLNASNTIIVTGAPGTGKTTVIRAVRELASLASLHLELAAPTGKAAQRMGEVCASSASTIHRLLGFQGGSFLYNEQNQFEADIIVLDEASMIDVALMKHFLKALAPATTLVIVGDKDQLPSVGAGRVFNDIIESKLFPVSYLTAVYRRSGLSNINTIANDINAGVFPSALVNHGKDVEFIETSDVNITTKEILNFAKQYKDNFDKALILTPMNQGDMGVVNLNQLIQAHINPIGDSIEYGKVTFRVGDRVCQRTNNYTITPQGVFNGDIGVVQEIDKVDKKMLVKFWDGQVAKYDMQTIKQLALGYVMTIHRSQGSEAQHVIMIVNEAHFILLNKQLLYTGITRAKQKLTVIGSRKAITMAINNLSGSQRNSYLKELLI